MNKQTILTETMLLDKLTFESDDTKVLLSLDKLIKRLLELEPRLEALEDELQYAREDS